MLLSVRNLQNIHVGPIDLDLEKGEILALVGPSGSGKSQILRMIADLVPHHGDVFLESLDRANIPAPQWRKSVRFSSAESAWWAPTLSEHFPRDAEHHLASLGLKDGILSLAPHLVSTGERQRLALLRATISNPKVLLLDEPTSALDPETTLLVEDYVRNIAAMGTGIILVSHDGPQRQRLAHRQIEMHQ